MTTNNGLLLLDKPSGLTSHDVVAQVRKILNEQRVGHAGTLDPMATGLLVLGVGASTRLLRFAQSEVKRYRGTVQLGVATDSLDAQGTPTREEPVPVLTVTEMNEAAAAMLGRQMQVPPMVSAIKVGGRRLHALAREGVEVERAPREVTVSAFTFTPGRDLTRWNFDVECSVGTYVRVLLSDLAERVATVGHLVALRRISSGRHHVDDALSLDAFADVIRSGRSPLRPPADFVTELPRVALDEDQERRLRMGQQIELAHAFAPGELAAFASSGALVAILCPRGEKWKPQLVLPAMSSGVAD
jgi:tRNA pseudouridine55 synthase